jgi:hypothetical protein
MQASCGIDRRSVALRGPSQVRVWGNLVDACVSAAEWKAAKAKPHPLYQTSAQAVGVAPKGVEVSLEPPKFGRVGHFTQVRWGVWA